MRTSPISVVEHEPVADIHEFATDSASSTPGRASTPLLHEMDYTRKSNGQRLNLDQKFHVNHIESKGERVANMRGKFPSMNSVIKDKSIEFDSPIQTKVDRSGMQRVQLTSVDPVRIQHFDRIDPKLGGFQKVGGKVSERLVIEGYIDEKTNAIMIDHYAGQRQRVV